MKKLFIVVALLASTISAQAWYVVPPKPIVVPSVGTSSAAGVAATSGFLGFVAALAGYDIIRRWTCSGDFLRLGGPGFSEPMPAHGNVKPPPACGRDLSAKRRNVVRVKG